MSGVAIFYQDEVTDHPYTWRQSMSVFTVTTFQPYEFSLEFNNSKLMRQIGM